MKIKLFILCSIILIFGGCIKSKVHKPSLQKIGKELLSVYIVSYFDAEDKIKVPDYLIDGDTIYFNQRWNIENDTSDCFCVDSTNYMVIKEHDFIKCEFDVYKSDNTFLKSGTMSFNQALRIVHPYSNDLKISFYDYQQELLAKYKVMLCNKYKITPDELDSLSYLLFPELDTLKSVLLTNSPNQK